MVFSSWSFRFSPLRKTSEKNLQGTFSACRVETPLERGSPRPDRIGQDIGHAENLSQHLPWYPLYGSPPGSHPGAPSPGQTLSIRSEGLMLFLSVSKECKGGILGKHIHSADPNSPSKGLSRGHAGERVKDWVLEIPTVSTDLPFSKFSVKSKSESVSPSAVSNSAIPWTTAH